MDFWYYESDCGPVLGECERCDDISITAPSKASAPSLASSWPLMLTGPACSRLTECTDRPSSAACIWPLPQKVMPRRLKVNFLGHTKVPLLHFKLGSRREHSLYTIQWDVDGCQVHILPDEDAGIYREMNLCHPALDALKIRHSLTTGWHATPHELGTLVSKVQTRRGSHRFIYRKRFPLDPWN